jgi:ribonuclease D
MTESESSNPPEPAEYIYVREAAALEALVRRVHQSERIALDTEADSLHNYFEKVCLIQLSLDGAHYIVDPLSGLELSGLAEALAGKPLIVHGGDYDLRMLRTSIGFRPRGEVSTR